MATNGMKIKIGEKDVPIDEVSVRGIVRGPSSMALLTALACAYPDRYSGRPSIWVKFGTQDGDALAWIYGLRHETGNDESWNIDGELSYGSPNARRFEFGGYYNTRTREGSLRVRDRI